MNVGLPGTGIGGIFYLLSIFFILGYEIYLAIRGKSNRKRWQAVQEQVFIASTMIAMAVATNYIMSEFVFTKPPLVVTPTTTVTGNIFNFYLVHPIFFPVTLLFLVLMATHGIHLLLVTKRKYRQKIQPLFS